MAPSHRSVTRAVVCGPLRRSVRRRPCELRRPWAYLSGAVRFAQLPLTRTPLTPILNEYKREREARMGIPFLILYLPRSPVQVHTHWGQARVGPVPLLRDQGLHRRVHTELDVFFELQDSAAVAFIPRDVVDQHMPKDFKYVQ